jgi:hypothetical protein
MSLNFGDIGLDARTIQALHEENTGTEDERVKVIVARARSARRIALRKIGLMRVVHRQLNGDVG